MDLSSVIFYLLGSILSIGFAVVATANTDDESIGGAIMICFLGVFSWFGLPIAMILFHYSK